MALNQVVCVFVVVGHLQARPNDRRQDRRRARYRPFSIPASWIWNSAKTGSVPASVSPAVAMAEAATVQAECRSFRCSIEVFRKCSPKKALLMIWA